MLCLGCPRRGLLFAQLTTGIIEGVVRDASGRARLGATVTAAGTPAAFRWSTKSNLKGEFKLVLPYGEYRITAAEFGSGAGRPMLVHVYALQTSRINVTVGESPPNGAGPAELKTKAVIPPWTSWNAGKTQLDLYPGPYSVAGILLGEEPSIVAQPLDFTGMGNTRLPLVSQRAFSWTGSEYRLQGIDATDSYQPGRPAILPDTEALDEVTVRSGGGRGFGTEINLFPRQAGNAWHGQLTSTNTGAPLASSNLPGLVTRGTIQQAEQYHWFTRDHLQISGPLSQRADAYFSGTGQWASQTIPIALPGEDQNSRLLFGNVGGRVQLTSKDQLDLLVSGSRIDLSDWGEPAGLEALTGWRMMPAYVSMYGFGGLPEEDHLDFIQAGWTRQAPVLGRPGVIQVRYGYSIAHLDTHSTTNPDKQGSTELLGGSVSGAPPLSNLAVRARQSIAGAFQPGDLQRASLIHRIVIGSNWARSNSENRFNSPSDRNLISTAGIPAFVVQLNTPSTSRARIQSFAPYVRDRVALAPWFSLDLGVLGNVSRAELPGRASVIDWNSASPHIGVAIAAPGLPRLMFRGSYTRAYAPLAGRYLDFANPQSLSGLVFQWTDLNRDGVFQSDEQGVLLRRFGGAYSTISPSLRRPYADQFEAGASLSLPFRISATIQMFRRDEKDRIATLNVGVPPQAYQPRMVPDPGPDSIPATFDDGQLVVYEQDPATFGQDRFLLTNPPGLRMLYEGLVAEVSAQLKYATVHASFTAEKSFGPTNPGNGPLENDAGIVGSLYQDPNTLINSTGRDFFDRGYVGKVQTSSRLPARLGGLELSNIVDYLDGLVFARNLLITGLAQGPFLQAATLRGSPEGGNRAEYVLNWNLRLSRAFRLNRREISFAADLLNVTNSGNRVQESDISGTAFNARLPIAIQVPRFLRLSIRYNF